MSETPTPVSIPETSPAPEPEPQPFGLSVFSVRKTLTGQHAQGENMQQVIENQDRYVLCLPGREPAMGLLRVAVLGSPEVFHDGSRLTFALRKAQALLIYLAVEGGMHSRSKLAALLWPDSEPADARKTLRNAITLLRSLLADASAAPSHLLAEQDLLGLNPQALLELDLDVVQQTYTAAQRFSTVPSEAQRATLVTQVQQALDLVRGPFLDGFWLREEAGFDDGVQQQQQQWQGAWPEPSDRASTRDEEAR